MVLRLEEIRLNATEINNNNYDYENMDKAYAQAFSDFGIDVLGLPAAEAAARLRSRNGVTVALVAALDDWAIYRGGARDKSQGLALLAVAQAAERDPWRRRLRQSLLQNDSKAIVDLATSPELARQPRDSLYLLATALRSRGLVETEIEVLRQAQRQYPGDFMINLRLAAALQDSGSSHRRGSGFLSQGGARQSTAECRRLQQSRYSAQKPR